MPTTTKSTHATTVYLKVPTKVTALTSYAQGIVTAMTGNPQFPDPTPAPATVTAAITEYTAAETAALTRAKGTAATRNVKRAALVQLLEQLKTYVQTVVDATAEGGASIAQGAGMAVRKVATRAPRVFALKPGAVSGTVKVIAPSAGNRAAYDWQYSTDGGKTWIVLPSTLQAKTSISGLQAGSQVQVKYSAVTRTGEGNWSAPVTLLVQ